VVEDDGQGFEHSAPLERGESGGGSTGLGLDIALRAAERTGGTLQLGASASGGARVEVVLGPPAT
jgi:signal transduction histidine kinase